MAQHFKTTRCQALCENARQPFVAEHPAGQSHPTQTVLAGRGVNGIGPRPGKLIVEHRRRVPDIGIAFNKVSNQR